MPQLIAKFFSMAEQTLFQLTWHVIAVVHSVQTVQPRKTWINCS